MNKAAANDFYFYKEQDSIVPAIFYSIYFHASNNSIIYTIVLKHNIS